MKKVGLSSIGFARPQPYLSHVLRMQHDFVVEDYADTYGDFAASLRRYMFAILITCQAAWLSLPTLTSPEDVY